MKRIILSVMMVAVAVISCQKEEKIQDEIQSNEFSFTVSLSGDKTVNDNLSTKWVAGDEINVFHAVAGSTGYINDGKFSIDEAGLSSGKFTGSLGEALDKSKSYDWYVFYPYTSDIDSPSCSGKGYVTVGNGYGKSQVQDGNDSRAHLAGTALPLSGSVKENPGSAALEVSLSQLCSVVKVVVENTTNEDLTVTGVSFTGTEDIVGSYCINFAGDTPVFTAKEAAAVSNKADLTVENGTPISNGESASFFIALKPFTAAAGSTVKVAVNGYEKTIDIAAAKTFRAGSIHKVGFNYDKTTHIAAAFTKESPSLDLDMIQGAIVDFSGVDGFSQDVDFFDKDEDVYKFRCVSGKYKLVADYDYKFIRVDPVNEDGTYISSYSAEEGVKAIYAVGSGVSKGGIPAVAWSTTAGAWPLAQYEKDKYCISFLAGRDVVSGSYFHLYNCRGSWTSTFAHTAFKSVDLGTAFVMDMSSAPAASGNIGTKTLELGKGYRLLFDFTDGYDKGVVTIEDVEFPIVGKNVTVFGYKATFISDDHYCVTSASITKGAQYWITGVENPSSLWVDPDYVTDNKFSAMTGYYQIDVYTDKSYVAFRRLKSDGGAVADINTGAIWLMGWGVGMPSLTGTTTGDNEPGWTPAKAIPMAEIEEGVYQFSGYAAAESSTTVGDRFRYDYLGLVWYGEQGWNQGLKGGMKGTTNTIQYTQRAQELLANSQGANWQTLAKSLEQGAFYVLTIDLNTPNVELVDFYKKED